jgi:hypothetical protein
MLRVLAERNTRLRSRDASPRFAIVDRIGGGLIWFGCLVFVVAIAAGLLGWHLGYARYLANIGILVAALGWICCVCALLAALPDVVRRARFWRNEVSLLVTDSLVAEELARYSPIDLKTLSQMLGLRREIHQSRQRFVLGPGGNVSPFLVLLVALTIPHTDIVKLAGQYAPLATQLTAGPAGWIVLSALLLSFVFAGFRALDVDETYSVQIGLVASALERARTSQSSTIAPIEVPPPTLTGQADSKAQDPAIAQSPAEESTNPLTEDHESYLPVALPAEQLD